MKMIESSHGPVETKGRKSTLLKELWAPANSYNCRFDNGESTFDEKTERPSFWVVAHFVVHAMVYLVE